MAKWIKIVLGALGVILLVCVLALAAAALLFDPNDFRNQIAAAVKKATGRELTLKDIHLGVFPTLEARVQGATLGNAAGFGTAPFAQVGEAQVGVRLLPLLLHRQLQVGSVSLKNVQLQLVRRADGKTNWEDLAAGKAAKTAAPAAPEGGAGPGLASIEIGGVDVDNATLRYEDQQAKKSYTVSGLKLHVGAIHPPHPFAFELSFTTQLAQPAMQALVDLKAQLSVDPAAKLAQARDLQLDVLASGKGVPGGRLPLKLTGNARYDGGKGTFKLADARLQAASLNVAANLDGSGLNGGAIQFSGPLTVQPFDPREVFKALALPAPQTADSNVLKQASLSAQLAGTTNSLRLADLKLQLDQSHLAGTLSVTRFSPLAVQFALALDELDADRYLPPVSKAAAAKSGGAAAAAGDNRPLPTDLLDTLGAEGTLTVGKLKVQNLSLSQVQLRVNAAKGGDKRAQLSAALYGGTLESSTRLGAGDRPAWAETAALTSINAGPLLKDYLGKDALTGLGNFKLDVTSSGRTVAELKRALNGTLAFDFRNGAIKGFNLAQIIRQGQALVSGQAAGLANDQTQQTDFSALSGSGRITNGVLYSDDLSAQSPLFRLTGAGRIDLVGNTIDYVAKPMLVNTATGQGGKELANLNGVVIPVHFTGPLTAPRYQLDVQSALQQKAVQKLGEKLGTKLQNNPQAGELLNQLKGLFGNKPPSDPGAQSPPP